MPMRGPLVVVTLFLSSALVASCAPATAYTPRASVFRQFETLVSDARISSSIVTGYRIEALGQLVGLALVGQNLAHVSGPEQTRIYLFDRIGTSQALHAVSLDLRGDSQSASTISGQYRFVIEDQIVSEFHYEWAYAGGKMHLLRGQSSTLFPQPLLEVARSVRSAVSGEGADKPISLPFFNPAGDGQQLVFDPFRGTLSGSDEELAPYDASYDPDGFARSFSWSLMGKLPLKFARADKSELAHFFPTLWHTAVSLADFTPDSELGPDLARLRQTAARCKEETTELQDRFVRKSPNVPYLLHRRVTVLKNLCDGTAQFAQLYGQTKDPEKRIRYFRENVRLNLSHHPSEVPGSMTRSPQWSVIFDDQKSVLWLNSLNDLIRDGLAELSDSLEIEMERKKVVKLRTVLKEKSLGTVIKAVITHNKPVVSITLNESGERNMLPDSWRESPWGKEAETAPPAPAKTTKSSSKKPAPVATPHPQPAFPFQLYNGKSVVLTRLDDFSRTCQAFNGKVGIDLGDAPQSVLSGPVLSGGWDNTTRLRLLELFLRKASGQNACRDLVVRVPTGLKTQAAEEIRRFNESILQTDQEFQLKNAKFRHLRMLPGTYTLHVHSLISGSLLARRELSVEDTEEPQSFTFDIAPDTANETAAARPPVSTDGSSAGNGLPPSQAADVDDEEAGEDEGDIDTDSGAADRFGSSD